MARPRILIADDDPIFAAMLVRFLEAKNWTVEAASDGRQALRLLGEHAYDVAVLDMIMPRVDGIEILKAIRKNGIATDVVMLTGYATVEKAVESLQIGAKVFLQKPIGKQAFIEAINRLVEERHYSPHVLANRLDAFLRDRASDSGLRLTDLLSYFDISMSYASKLFREYVGGSFRNRLSYHRVQKAKKLIKYTDDPLYTIAELSGFKNQQRLRDAFIRHEGAPPSLYRRRQRG